MTKYGSNVTKYEPSVNQVEVNSKPLDFYINQVFPQHIPSTTQVQAEYTTWAILSSYSDHTQIEFLPVKWWVEVVDVKLNNTHSKFTSVMAALM
jgi:hypothetical protein